MSKRGFISRYLLIIEKLKAKPYSSFSEIYDYIEHKFDYLQMQDDTLTIGFSVRTFQRDKKEISNLFGIDIEYSRSEKGYFISQNEAEQMNFQRMIEAFDMFNSLNLAQNLTPYLHLEQRRPQGTENLSGLLHAIKNRLSIKFEYQKFWEEEVSRRFAAPYALKEFRNRWYVMAADHKDGPIKSFALDRLSKLEITKEHFTYPEGYNAEEKYRYCFGIISSDDDEPQDIILSFTYPEGKYIKTLPLHHTQEILADNEKELRIKLRLYPTHDLLMELLSHGKSVKIIRPKSLAERVKQAHKEAFKQY